MDQRGKQYDKPQGERSMAATVAAYNAVTGQSITEANGWLLMALLKMVRDNQRSDPHIDSCEDLIAYSALYGEARLNITNPVNDINSAINNDGWIKWIGGECPVDNRQLVEVKLRDLSVYKFTADFYLWNHDNNDDDIIAYRLVK